MGPGIPALVFHQPTCRVRCRLSRVEPRSSNVPSSYSKTVSQCPSDASVASLMEAWTCLAGGGFHSLSLNLRHPRRPPQAHFPVDVSESSLNVKQKRRSSPQTTFVRWKVYGTCTPNPAPPCLNWVQWPSFSPSQPSPPRRSPVHWGPACLFFSCTFLLLHPSYPYLKIHSEKSAPPSGIQLLAVRMVFFAGNSTFGGSVTPVGAGGLACGAVTRGCRAGRRIMRRENVTRTLINNRDDDMSGRASDDIVNSCRDGYFAQVPTRLVTFVVAEC